MCRHLAYLGPPIPLADLLLDPPHSLLRQSWAPRDLRGGGTINADGHGAGWYPAPGPAGPGRTAVTAPVRHRSVRPLWNDGSFHDVARVTTSGAVLAAVRGASVGTPISESACAPFTDGARLFSLNGRLRDWPANGAALATAAGLGPLDLLTMEATMDSALLWAVVRRLLSEGAGGPERTGGPEGAGDTAGAAGSEGAPRGGADLGAALARTVALAAAVTDSRLNLLATDGTTIAATTWGHSLAYVVDGASVVVASEPLDDRAGWTAVPDGHLVVAAVPPAPTGPTAAPAPGATPHDVSADRRAVVSVRPLETP